MYYEGLGVKKDVQQAIQWYIKSARNGRKETQEYLKKQGIEY